MSHYNGLRWDKVEANRILAGVKAGIDFPASMVRWALWVTGDLRNE